ncbi:MAG: site-2 protease family protein [Patescibacteria group bacterium]|nr:site-2 protease family protein [Patescibacteria group bacterium]
MDVLSLIISVVILIFSVVVHEVSHGIIAEKLGDPTARNAGRLTLNPLPHLDIFGSILLPALLWIVTSGQIVLGSAKPVPVNYANLRHPKRDMMLVSLAGPGSNFLLAIASALPLRFGLFALSSLSGQFLLQVVIINVVLGVFNLIPIPPLDGSKVLAGVLSERFLPVLFSLERWGFVLIIAFLYLGWLDALLIPVITFFLKYFVGVGF